ncbi:caspase family protein [Kitasatospora sp. NPDC036755]|uniref:caspase family protein n=1 Tax=Kitasatospora sp. NPDC036755 TaxID=3154600 RepID=UPI0033FE3E71
MHYLIAAGTSTYGADEFDHLPRALDDVERMAAFLTSPGMGYTRVLGEVSHDPVSSEFEDALADWCAGGGLTAEDVVVVYYAGHGDQPVPGAPYRLACADTRWNRPRSWLSPQNMAEILAASPLRNVLFVIDSCHAARGAGEIQGLTDDIVALRPRGDEFGAGTWVLASARHRDAADDGAFVPRLIEVCTAGDGPSQRYLAPSAVAAKVNQVFVTEGRKQRVACSSNHQSEQPPFFPNPGHDPSAQVGEGDVPGDSSDLSSHFEPRGRGVEHVHDPGSYFTGRRKALGRLRDAMAGPGGCGALVVTAAPGSGKSAVLGKLVLEGCSDVSVNARHQTLEALVARLAAVADVRAAEPSALLTALARRRTPLRVVIDSLDEAGPAGDRTEARRIAWDLLRPLGAVPCVRLVVGSRRELLPHIGEQVGSIDLDSSQYADDTSTAEYVRRILGDTGSPYAGLDDRIAAIAGEVARRAGHCFLVARMTASALLRGGLLDTTVPGWAESLPSDVGGAFEAYLRRIPPDRNAGVTALLTALAFGEGNGLPRRIWLLVATRLSGIPLREADIDALVQEDGSYLTWAEVSATKHFRLYHQELTDYLRQRALKVRDLQDVQEGFVDVLLDLTPGRNWTHALPYVRRHLATHAAAAGSIQELVEDPAFVLAADPAGLLPAVRHNSCDPVLAMVVERFMGLPAAAGIDRAAHLAFTAESHGAADFAGRAEELSASVQRIRVEARTVTPHRIVGRHHQGTYSTTSMAGWRMDNLVLPDGGRVVIAAVHGSEVVYVWPIDDPSRATTLIHPSGVTHLRALPSHAGRALAASLDEPGDLRVWDVVDQTVTHHVRGARFEAILDVGELDNGTSVLACCTEKNIVVIDSDTETLFDIPIASGRAKGYATAAFVRRGGSTHLVVCDHGAGTVTSYAAEGGWEKTVLLRDLRSPLILSHAPLTLGSALVALWEPGEDSEDCGNLTLLDCASAEVLATGSHKTARPPSGAFIRRDQGVAFVAASLGLVLTYSTGTGRVGVDEARRAQSLHHLTPLDLAGETHIYAASTSFDGSVAIIDCTTGSPTGTVLHGHESAVCGLHALTPSASGTQDIVTIGNDGTARLWNVSLRSRDAPDPRIPENKFDKSTTQMIHHCPDRPDGFIVGSWSGLRVVDSGALRQDKTEALIAHRLPGTRVSSVCAHLAYGDTFHLVGKIENSSRGLTRSTLSWQQIRSGREVTCTQPPTLSMTSWQASYHLIPPSTPHPGIRLVGFDPEDGRIFFSGSPEETFVADDRWRVDNRSTITRTAGFANADGHAVLLIANRKAAAAGDFPANGQYIRVDTPDAALPTRGFLWNATLRKPLADSSVTLPARLVSLVPHHGDLGTRYIATASSDDCATVLDVDSRRIHPVYPARPAPDGGRELRNLTIGDDHYLRWADVPARAPVLAYMAGLSRDDTALSPVVVWDSAHPSAPARELPVRARRLLWTGAAPSGEALLAVSDEFGIRMFTLPGAEEVWSAPLPALVTSLAARPGSPYLDLGVATQQGVVLIRPRLTPYWQRRLLREP